jgi:hypothetical protein
LAIRAASRYCARSRRRSTSCRCARSKGLLSDRAPDETLPANVRTGARPGGEIVRAELSARREAWRVVWIARPHNIVRIAKLHRAEPRLFDGVRVIYDAEAVFALRTYRKQVLAGAPLSELQQRRALRAELLPAEIADHIVSVSHEERDIIRSYVTRPVEILGYGAGIVAATPSFASRRDLLFVGAVPVIETPNAESLQWFARDVLPAVAAAGLRLTVAGSGTQPTGALQSLAGPAFQLAGPQDDLAPVYAQARVFVAPTRYACGIPLKVSTLRATASRWSCRRCLRTSCAGAMASRRWLARRPRHLPTRSAACTTTSRCGNDCATAHTARCAATSTPLRSMPPCVASRPDQPERAG